MSQNTKRFSSLILSLIFGVSALVVFFDFVQPSYQDLQVSRGKEIAQQIVKQVKSLVSSYQSQTQGKQSVSLALPVGPDTAGALSQISGLAFANNIGIQTMSVTTQATPTGPKQANGLAAAASSGNLAKPVGTLSFQISAVGNYENFKNFVQGLESNTRVFDVKLISIHPGTIPGAKGGQDYFFYDVTVVAYYQTS